MNSNIIFQTVLGIIVLALLGVAIYYIVQIFRSEEDAGKKFAKGVMKNRIILLEVIAGAMNIVEALIAATAAGASGDKVHTPFATRFGVHIGISAIGMIGAFTMFTQVRQAFQALEIVGYAWKSGKIGYKKAIDLIMLVIKEVGEAFLVTVFAVFAPAINVFLTADAIGEQTQFWELEFISMSNILLGSFCLLALHQLIYVYIGISSFSVVFQTELNDQEEAMIEYAADKLGADKDALTSIFTSADTNMRKIKEVLTHKFVAINTQLGILSSTSASPDDKNKAKTELDKQNTRLKHYLNEQFK